MGKGTETYGGRERISNPWENAQGNSWGSGRHKGTSKGTHGGTHIEATAEGTHEGCVMEKNGLENTREGKGSQRKLARDPERIGKFNMHDC